MKRILSAILLVPALTLVPACGGESAEDGNQAEASGAFDGLTTAVCVLTPTEGNNAEGTLTFTQVSDGIRITGTITGLTPSQQHAYHIHQFGDVSAPDGTATGGHYNPEGNPHSLPEAHEDHGHSVTGGHAGDLGNLEADENGTATVDVTFSNLTLSGNNAILARAIIVHAGNDKGEDEQPSGAAGPRIAQGVIGIAEAEAEEETEAAGEADGQSGY